MIKLISRLRSSILVFLTHRLALPLLKLIRKEEKFPYTESGLQALPEGTLGRELHRFLQERNLRLLPYYARHDMKHILLGYDTTDEGEGSLQCFMLGNGHLSFPVLATVIYCHLTMPEHWRSFRHAFRRGRKASRIASWNWFAVVEEPVAQLKKRIFITVS